MASGNAKNFELKLGKTGLIVLVVGMAVLLCCSFLSGIVVGKNIDTYPEKIASLPQRLLALVWRPAKIKVAQSAAEKKKQQHEQNGKQEDIDLTFYNTLTSKKGITAEPPIPDRKPHAEAPPAEQILPQLSKADSGQSSPSAVTEIKQQSPKVKPGEDEIGTRIKEAEKRETVREAVFSIQVASMKEKTKAAQMSKKLSALGYHPRIVENNVAGKGRWYRVVIDGFATRALAQAAVEKISRNTGNNGVIKRKESPDGEN